jgi:Domain of unknown function (DUF3303)
MDYAVRRFHGSSGVTMEAAYFTDDNGQRRGVDFFEMKDAAEIPAIAEPWFLAFKASIELHPVMVPDDLAKAGGSIEKAVKKYTRSLAAKTDSEYWISF